MSAGRKTAAIVLAAGRSSRMGSRNKLRERIDGEAIVARVVGVAIASGADPVIVVTGCESDQVEEVLRGLTTTFVHNPEFAKGMSGSIKAGLEALPKDCDGALILLGDMPSVLPSDLEALMAAFAKKGSEAICVPVRHGRRGNPVLWGASYFAEMRQLSGDRGAKGLIAKYGQFVVEVPVLSDGIFADVDTPEDLVRLTTKIGSKP